MEELLLPAPILAKATVHSNEYAWPFDSVEEVIAAAQAAELATLGGQAQFRMPEGICEMYWLEADASDRRVGESWPEFVKRSAHEVLARFQDKVTKANYNNEARQWPILCEQIEKGTNVLDFLCFVLYFQAEPGKASEVH